MSDMKNGPPAEPRWRIASTTAASRSIGLTATPEDAMNAPQPAPIEVTNKQHAREQEGFARALGEAGSEASSALCCSTYPFGWPGFIDSDSRGSFAIPQIPVTRRIEWETTPAESGERTVFTWMGGSRTWPAFTPAFPYATAALSVDGRAPLRFPIGRPDGFRVERDGVALSFEPRQFHSLAEGHHRTGSAAGICGFYRLQVDGGLITAGRPLRLSIELGDDLPGIHAFAFVVPRTDCLKVDLRLLRDEVAQLQRELVTFKRSHERLAAQLYPELFPECLRGDRVLVTMDRIKHLHPATISAMGDGEVVVTMREGTDHLTRDGRLVIVRSRDGGRTWGPRELLFDRGGVDHRCTPIVELPNGDWVGTDYRPGDVHGIYDDQGVYRPHIISGPSVWGVWSTDRGRSWNFSREPLTVPGAHVPYLEVERHLIRLPSGRLLCGGGYYTAPKRHDGVAVFASDDDGRSWSCLARLESDPRCVVETTMLRTVSGKIILLVRTEPGLARGADGLPIGCLLQAESHDDGATWTAFRETTLSSLSTPAHLLQLQDGRILCSHASRAYPGSIYVTTSSDEGITWDSARTRTLADDLGNWDTAYPTSCQLADGTIITTWYANMLGRYYIPAVRYRADEV
jgi:hypothetical protein